MVSIRRYENEDRFGHTHFCGGVIIRSNLILTAAHCLIRNKQIIRPYDITVVAKTPMRLQKTPAAQILRVKKIIIHEKFVYSKLDYDIALLKLTKHIQLDNCAAVIAMPKQRINDSTACMVLGWGKLYLAGPLANEVLQLNVTLHSKNFCDFLLDIGSKKLCASDTYDHEKHPCSGDSGGPLICGGVLAGVVSYGFQCGYGLPTVYSDVYEYSNWIHLNKASYFNYFNEFLLLIVIIVVLCKNKIFEF
ncbi:hypothetical protein FF38_10183 [Lucilia cuprina]|uniref:Peptidase S1 domain-containing protein n=2 Tax=Lucilia cuprina TaxID=7375 RepID=A0A0L0CNT5_LUCCU|nr:hypothetical protein FF38_10183 [Lucilia cuprina]